MKFYKVVLTGIIMTQDDDPHPDSWDWSADKIYRRYQDIGGDGADIKITLLQDSLDISEPGESIIDEMTREAEENNHDHATIPPATNRTTGRASTMPLVRRSVQGRGTQCDRR